MLGNMLKPVFVPKCLWWWAPFPTVARRGYRVTFFDNPEPQIRGDAGDPATGPVLPQRVHTPQLTRVRSCVLLHPGLSLSDT